MKADGTATEGDVRAMFAESGDVVWTVHGTDGELFSWSPASGEELDLAAEEGLRLVGVWEDSAITVIEDGAEPDVVLDFEIQYKCPINAQPLRLEEYIFEGAIPFGSRNCHLKGDSPCILKNHELLTIRPVVIQQN